MVLGFGPTSTPPQRGGNETPAMPSGKIIIIAAGIVLLVAAMFAIFGGGGADVSSSSGGEGADVPAGSDSGSGGAVVPDDSDSESSAEFTPTVELTLSNGVVVKTRGLEIVKTPEGHFVPTEDMVAGTMYVKAGSTYKGPAASVEIATKKRKMDDISFSVDGVFVSNIRPENTGGEIYIFADMKIPEWKKVRTHIAGVCSKKRPGFSTSDMDLVADSLAEGSGFIGGSISESGWENTELVIIRFSVQNK